MPAVHADVGREQRPGWVPGVVLLVVLLAALLSGCSGGDDRVWLNPPFEGRTRLGEVRAVYRTTGEERAFANAVKLKEPEVRFDYRVDVENRAGKKLYLRLADFELVDEQGIALAKDEKAVACILESGAVEGVLSGQIWVPKRLASGVSPRKFGVGHLAVPLGDDGVAAYRKWLLGGRPNQAAQIDAEIARLGAAPACTRQ